MKNLIVNDSKVFEVVGSAPVGPISIGKSKNVTDFPNLICKQTFVCILALEFYNVKGEVLTLDMCQPIWWLIKHF